MTKTGNLWDDVVPRVDPERCKRCPDCASMAACAAHGFRRDNPDEVPVVDASICFGCYTCVGACPHRAIIPPKRGQAQ